MGGGIVVGLPEVRTHLSRVKLTHTLMRGVMLGLNKRKWVRLRLGGIIAVLAIVLASCSQVQSTPIPATTAPSPVNPTRDQAPDTPTPSVNSSSRSPTKTSEASRRELTAIQLIPRDAIRPIYDPTFISASDAALTPRELVIGVEFNGDSRAYPIDILRRREIVNDTVGGVPILVTW